MKYNIKSIIAKIILIVSVLVCIYPIPVGIFYAIFGINTMLFGGCNIEYGWNAFIYTEFWMYVFMFFVGIIPAAVLYIVGYIICRVFQKSGRKDLFTLVVVTEILIMAGIIATFFIMI